MFLSTVTNSQSVLFWLYSHPLLLLFYCESSPKYPIIFHKYFSRHLWKTTTLLKKKKELVPLWNPNIKNNFLISSTNSAFTFLIVSMVHNNFKFVQLLLIYRFPLSLFCFEVWCYWRINMCLCVKGLVSTFSCVFQSHFPQQMESSVRTEKVSVHLCPQDLTWVWGITRVQDMFAEKWSLASYSWIWSQENKAVT